MRIRSIDERLHNISTKLITRCGEEQFLATGFFYNSLSPKDPSKKGQWRTIENIWLVTNRHVIVNERDPNPKIIDKLTFHLRAIEDNSCVWVPFFLNHPKF